MLGLLFRTEIGRISLGSSRSTKEGAPERKEGARGTTLISSGERARAGLRWEEGCSGMGCGCVDGTRIGIGLTTDGRGSEGAKRAVSGM